MSTATVRHVEFGLGRHEPTLRVVEADGLMDIAWGQVPYDYEAEYQLVNAIEKSGIHAWLRSLFHENEQRIPLTSTLWGPGYGAWSDCPADIGEKVVDIMTTFIRDAMGKIIPTLGFRDEDL